MMESIGNREYKKRSLEDAGDSDIFISYIVYFQLYATKHLEINLFFGKILDFR
jgi:hypothetical protein